MRIRDTSARLRARMACFSYIEGWYNPPPPADHLRARSGDLFDLNGQAAYLSDALAIGDPASVVLALIEIGTLRRIIVALDENPPLGEILRTMRELGFDLAALEAKA